MNKLERALMFYGDPKRYDGPNQRAEPQDPFTPSGFPFMIDVSRDRGALAREALYGPAERNERDRNDALEEAARLCVTRSITWSTDDDERSQDYREGIEVAASQLAAAIRGLKS